MGCLHGYWTEFGSGKAVCRPYWTAAWTLSSHNETRFPDARTPQLRYPIGIEMVQLLGSFPYRERCYSARNIQQAIHRWT